MRLLLGREIFQSKRLVDSGGELLMNGDEKDLTLKIYLPAG